MKKTIKALLCGASTLAIFACSEADSNSTAPEASRAQITTDSTAKDSSVVNPDASNQDNLPQNVPSTEIPDESDQCLTRPDTVSVEQAEAYKKEFIESVLKSDRVDNAVEIDCFLTPDDFERMEPCGQSRYSLLKGDLIHLWLGETNTVRCESDSVDLIRYEISVPYEFQMFDTTGHFIKKQLTTSNEQIIAAFETDCEIEGGTNSLEENGTHLCSIEPTVNPDFPNSIYYADPNWKKYGSAVVNICKGEPIDINPSAVPPIDFDDQDRRHPNQIRMGECKAEDFIVRSALAKETATESPKAKIITDDEGNHEIMIPDVSDYCSIDVGLVRELVGEILYIRYDKDCKEHEAHFNSTGTEGCYENSCILTAPTYKQFDKTCSPAVVSKCVCISDHYFPVDSDYLRTAKYVIFNDVTYPIENPIQPLIFFSP